MSSPFLSPDPILQSADAVLVAVTAGMDVPFAEVEQVLTHVQRQAEQAQVVTGASVDPAFAGSLAVLVLASIGGSAPLPEAGSGMVGTSEPDTARRIADPRDDRPVLDEGLSLGTVSGRSTGGLVPPAPELSPQQREQLGVRAGGRPGVRKRKAVQSMFNFEVVSRGRFDKTEATVLHGQDLDVPTFIRRGIALN